MKNSKPLYRKVGNTNLFLAFTNATDYPLPWTMWGGPGYSPGTHVGNIKFGPKNIACPHHYKVMCVNYFEQNLTLLLLLCNVFQKIFLYTFFVMPFFDAEPSNKLKLICGVHSEKMPFIKTNTTSKRRYFNS